MNAYAWNKERLAAENRDRLLALFGEMTALHAVGASYFEWAIRESKEGRPIPEKPDWFFQTLPIVRERTNAINAEIDRIIDAMFA